MTREDSVVLGKRLWLLKLSNIKKLYVSINFWQSASKKN